MNHYIENKIISHLLNALKNYHNETYLHSIRVAKLSFKVSKNIQLKRSEQLYI